MNSHISTLGDFAVAEDISTYGHPMWLAGANELTDFSLKFSPSDRALWQFMKPNKRPSFTTALLGDMNRVLDMIELAYSGRWAPAEPPVKYLILASQIPGIFNLGGDLDLFLGLIRQCDVEGLRSYAHACIKVQYRRAINCNTPVHTIALVQGDALGGGMEAALAHDAIIAERGAKFGLPEILFNLFPGMGAYSFLARRLNATVAEQMMLSGRLYEAEELHALGLIDRLAEPGRGIEAVHDYIADYERTYKARTAVGAVRRMVNPITEAELLAITDLWAETAATLSAKDLRKMEHLCNAQNRRWAKIQAGIQ